MPKVQEGDGGAISPPAKAYLGVDPGTSGGLAIISGAHVDLVAMLPTERDIFDWINAEDVTFAVIEKNTGYVGDDGNPGSAMFKFGMNTGLLKMALVACEIPFEEVSPATWQKAIGVPTRGKGEPKGHFKNRLKAHAQKLFPSEKVTLSICDALLIAEFCRRKREGLLKIG